MDKYKWYKEHGTIYNTKTDKDICIVYDHQNKEDLKLVLNSLNNYPKAIELLKECKSQMTENYRGLPSKIDEFLKEIEN